MKGRTIQRALWATVCIAAAYSPPATAQEPTESPLMGTSHEFEFGSVEPTDGSCSSLCHDYLDPGLARELGEVMGAWSTSLEADSSGIVAAMCGSCHHSTGGYAAVMADAFSDGNAYNERSHGRRMALSSPPPGTNVHASGLPRIEAGFFHCSTCHNPHSDVFRPFLQDDRRTLCIRCHTDRGFAAGSLVSGTLALWGDWQPASCSGRANPGSHPVGADVAGGRADGPSTSIPAVFRVAASSTADHWSVGPHLSDGENGTLTCQTCHAVHGLAIDYGSCPSGPPPVAPSAGYLAVAQQCKNLPDYARSLPNGEGAINALCESCHGTSSDPALRTDGSRWDGMRTNAHPGRPGAYSHPADGYPSGHIVNTVTPPDVWPSGTVENADGPILICESCHAPHPLAAAKAGRADVRAANGGYLLRMVARGDDGEERLCDVCHPESLPGHHPVGKSYDPTGAASLASAPSGSRARLRCSTCHNTAHDWRASARPALDPGWVPPDGGRSVDQASDMFNSNMSKTCMDCHYFMDGDGESVSPTMGTRQTVIPPDSPEWPHFQSGDFSMGTHYIGRIHDDEKERWSNQSFLEMYDTTRTWRMQAPESGAEWVMADGWSRFGGEDVDGKRVLVCESCHELEPDRNQGNTHLLLAPYQEGRVGMNEYDGDQDGKDILCLSCHGVLNGSHPMTGDVVSSRKRVRDWELDTHSKAVRETILGNASLVRDGGVDAMSCDSCHQPHDANSASFTFMLDSPQDAAGVEPIKFRTEDLIDGYGVLDEESLEYHEANGQPKTYATPKPTIVNYKGLCIQCHER